ncbi:hypothetical protein JXB02_01680 [Candidatus Woesearchaeota archaeon]|nr:hypothetical protein [Candidatus Woesearchaeota archaeon]
MDNINDRCYQSDLSTSGFDQADALAINFLMAQGLFLRGRGYTPAETGIYLDGKRFIIARMVGKSSHFGAGGQSLGLPDERTANPEDYAAFLEMLMGGDVNKATVITSSKDVTDQLLKAEGLTSIIGKPDGAVPYIEAKYSGKQIDIITGR